MKRFLLRRLAWFGVTFWAVVTVSFFLMRAVPGGPFGSDRALPAAIERAVRARYHLDWPLWRQYLDYLGPLDLSEHGAFGTRERVLSGVLAGDLGPSLKYRDFTVNDVIAQSLPVSMALGVAALAWALAVGIACGLLAALRPGGRADAALRLAASAGIALPNFALAGLLVLVFVYWLPIFPVAGWGSWRQLALPALALGAPFAAYAARLTRTGMLEVLSQDWIRAARAKGMPPRTIVFRHALRGALLPVVSWLGPAAAGVLTGSLVIERIFHVPGTGSHFVNSALNRDYTLAMGVTIVYMVLVYGFNTLVDVTYALLDPRVKLGARS
jgi:oligopeptide transport system permease protein